MPGVKKLLGYSDYENKEININKNLKLKDKIMVIVHESIHYFIDKLKLGNNYHFLNDFITTLITAKSKKKIKKTIKLYFNHYYNQK